MPRAPVPAPAAGSGAVTRPAILVRGARFALVAGALSLATWEAYDALGRPALGVDDAHIFFVYGRNLAAGHGLVYSPGFERVEGFSSPLWMLVVAAAMLLTAHPEALLLLVSLVLVAAALVALWGLVDRHGHPSAAVALLLGWVFSAPGFVVWTTLTLMDTALWTAVLLAGAVAALSPSSPRALAAVTVALLTARPEGMLWAPLLIAIAALRASGRPGPPAVWRSVRLPLFAYLAAMTALFGFRLAYFGYPLPNTYYAKVSPDVAYNLREGGAYLGAFVRDNPPVMVALLAALVGLVANVPWVVRAVRQADADSPTPARFLWFASSAIVLAGLAVPVWTGGDHFQLYRFFQPIWPLCVLPVLCLLQESFAPWRKYPAACVALGTVLLFVWPAVTWTNGAVRARLRDEFTLAMEGRFIGRTLNSMFPEDPPSIGVIAAGGIGYAYRGRVVDVLGLNNVAMAHAPGERHGRKNHAAFNADVFLAQRPDLFLPVAREREKLLEAWRRRWAGQNAAVGGVLSESRFRDLYQLAILDRGGRHVIVYVRRDVLPRLAGRGVGLEVVGSPDA